MSTPTARGKKKGGVGPDPAALAEERLVDALDHVTARALEDPPADQDGLPAVVLQALCELHPRYKEQAEYRRMQAQEKKLQDELQRLEMKVKEANAPGSRGKR